MAVREGGSCPISCYTTQFVVLQQYDIIYPFMCLLAILHTIHRHLKFQHEYSNGALQPSSVWHSVRAASWQLAKPYKAILNCGCRRRCRYWWPTRPIPWYTDEAGCSVGCVGVITLVQTLQTHTTKLTLLAEVSSDLSFTAFRLTAHFAVVMTFRFYLHLILISISLKSSPL